MKKKTLGLLLAGVAAASMIGTGFAAWIITGNAEAEETGQFKVDTVTEKGVTITTNFDSNTQTINFLAPDSTASTGRWLTNDGGNGYANLTVSFNVSFAFTGTGAAADFDVTYAFDYSAVQAAITDGYITAPTLTVGSTVVTSSSVFDATNTTVTIEFDWGAAFDNQNPYNFYNDFAYGTLVKENATGTPEASEAADAVAIQDVASEALTALANAVSGKTYTITITATPHTAN